MRSQSRLPYNTSENLSSGEKQKGKVGTGRYPVKLSDPSGLGHAHIDKDIVRLVVRARCFLDGQESDLIQARARDHQVEHDFREQRLLLHGEWVQPLARHLCTQPTDEQSAWAETARTALHGQVLLI